MYKLIKYDPDERITARQALRSEWCHTNAKQRKTPKGKSTGKTLFDSILTRFDPFLTLFDPFLSLFLTIFWLYFLIVIELGRESSRDSGVDLDSPSVASTYNDRNRKKEKDVTKKGELKKYPAKSIAGISTAAEQIADPVKDKSNRSSVPKFKFSKAQGFDLRRAIQQKVIFYNRCRVGMVVFIGAWVRIPPQSCFFRVLI